MIAEVTVQRLIQILVILVQIGEVALAQYVINCITMI